MLKNRRIAVIDDDEDSRSSVVALLRSLGCSARAYASADAYLAEMTTSWECVISDIEMPGTDGFQLLSALRCRAEGSVVILMTASPIPDARQRAIQAGATCFLEKPIDEDVLFSCLSRVLDGHG